MVSKMAEGPATTEPSTGTYTYLSTVKPTRKEKRRQRAAAKAGALKDTISPLTLTESLVIVKITQAAMTTTTQTTVSQVAAGTLTHVAPPATTPTTMSASALYVEAQVKAACKTQPKKMGMRYEQAARILADETLPAIYKDLRRANEYDLQQSATRMEIALAEDAIKHKETLAELTKAGCLCEDIGKLNAAMGGLYNTVFTRNYVVEESDVAALLTYEENLKAYSAEAQEFAVTMAAKSAEYHAAIAEITKDKASDKSLGVVCLKTKRNPSDFRETEAQWNKMVTLWGNHESRLNSVNKTLREDLQVLNKRITDLQTKMKPLRDRIYPPAVKCVPGYVEQFTNTVSYYLGRQSTSTTGTSSESKD